MKPTPTPQTIDSALRALDTQAPPNTVEVSQLRRSLGDGERALFDRALELRQGYSDLHERVLRSAAFAEASLGTAAFIHELRQCLSPLIGLSELMKETPDSPYVREWVGEISGQAQRIADLLDRHAALLRTTASEEEACEVAPLVAEAARYFTRLPPGVKLVSELPPELPRVLARRRQLLHAMINLLANARDAQKGKTGTIRIGARVVKDQVEIVISDQGSGVDPSIRERLFEPLFTTKQEEGTGLGLFLSRELLRPHGDLVLMTEALPEGAKTAFAIRLPREGTRRSEATQAAAAQLAEAARSQPAQLDPWAEARGRALAQLEPMVREERNNPVLLVEDEPAVRRMTRAVLESVANIKIYEAADAAFAFKLLDKVKVDFLVCDKNLPDQDGLEVIRHARTQHPGIDAMIVTGYPSPDSAAEAIRVGATDYLLKPVREVKTLRESVSGALSRQKLRRLAERADRLVVELARELLERAPAQAPARIVLANVLAAFDESDAPVRVAVMGGVQLPAALPGISVERPANPDALAQLSSDVDLILFGAESSPEVAQELLAMARARPSLPHLMPVGRFAQTETAVVAIQGRTAAVLDHTQPAGAWTETLQLAAQRRRREVRGEALRAFLKELGLSI